MINIAKPSNSVKLSERDNTEPSLYVGRCNDYAKAVHSSEWKWGQSQTRLRYSLLYIVRYSSILSKQQKNGDKINYQQMYINLCERGKVQREMKDGWGRWEKHHIIPKHSGGSNDKNNITTLQHKEHRIAHKLLYKIYQNLGDKIACNLMLNDNTDKLNQMSRIIGLEQFKLKKGIHNIEGNRKAVDAHKRWIEENPDKVKQIASDSHKNRTKEDYLKMAHKKAKYLPVSPEGVVFGSVAEAAHKYGVKKHNIDNWCRRNQFGWTRTQNTDKA